MCKLQWRTLLFNSAMLGTVLLIATKPLGAEAKISSNASKNSPNPIVNYSQSNNLNERQDFHKKSKKVRIAQIEKENSRTTEATASSTSKFLYFNDLSVSNLAPPAVDTDIAQVPLTQIDGVEPIDPYSLEEDSNDTLDQVTDVNQLRDVSPEDWAFEALRALVERYGCIEGYPDQTYRGNRALTRYEFAAGLNACLTQIESLIAATGERIAPEDLERLQRLAQEFEAELATIGARIDNFEGRVAFLEDNLFSVTTKLQGEIVFLVADEFISDDFTNNTIFGDRIRLDLNTSFTGRDLLFTRITATNIEPFQLAAPSIDAGREPNQQTVFGVPVAEEGELGFVEDREISGGANAQDESTQGIARFSTLIDSTPDTADNDVEISKIYYQFPFDGLEIYAFATGGEHHDYAPVLNPFFQDFDSGLGSITTLSSENPIYRIGGGAGVALNLRDVLGPTTLTVGYLAGPDPADPSESNGLFDGNYAILAQIQGNIGNRISLAFTYVHGYHPAGSPIFDAGRDTSTTDEDGEVVPGGGVVGTAVANNPSAELGEQLLSLRQQTLNQPLFICQPPGCDPANAAADDILEETPDQEPEPEDIASEDIARAQLPSTGIPLRDPVGLVPTVTNSYGVEASFRVANKISISAFGSYTDAILIGEGDSEIWTYGLAIALIDFLKEGSVLGLFGGVQPYAGFVSGSGGKLTVDEVPVQVEAFYKYQVTDNISITPGVIWISAPNQGVVQDLDSSAADDALVGVLRTTFSF